jgi:hypothetical protein
MSYTPEQAKKMLSQAIDLLSQIGALSFVSEGATLPGSDFNRDPEPWGEAEIYHEIFGQIQEKTKEACTYCLTCTCKA